MCSNTTGLANLQGFSLDNEFPRNIPVCTLIVFYTESLYTKVRVAIDSQKTTLNFMSCNFGPKSYL